MHIKKLFFRSIGPSSAKCQWIKCQQVKLAMGRGKNYLVCEIFGSVNVQISCIGGVSGGVSNLSRNSDTVKIKAEVSWNVLILTMHDSASKYKNLHDSCSSSRYLTYVFGKLQIAILFQLWILCVIMWHCTLCTIRICEKFEEIS